MEHTTVLVSITLLTDHGKLSLFQLTAKLLISSKTTPLKDYSKK